jgi:hypothetical protein
MTVAPDTLSYLGGHGRARPDQKVVGNGQVTSGRCSVGTASDVAHLQNPTGSGKLGRASRTSRRYRLMARVPPEPLQHL